MKEFFYISVYNSVCHWCICKDCTEKYCPDGKHRCINVCKYYTKSKISCNFFRDKNIKPIKIKRPKKANNEVARFGKYIVILDTKKSK